MTRVLIVDDEQGLRILVNVVLKSIGYETVEAADGEEALAILGTDPRFAAVISDVHMAGMDEIRPKNVEK